MNFLLSYNENNYLYSWKGAVHVNLDVILQNLSKCTRYSLLDEVSIICSISTMMFFMLLPLLMR